MEVPQNLTQKWQVKLGKQTQKLVPYLHTKDFIELRSLYFLFFVHFFNNNKKVI